MDAFAEAIEQVGVLDADDFGEYGTSGQELNELRAWFAAWRTELFGSRD